MKKNQPSFLYHVYPLGALDAEKRREAFHEPLTRLRDFERWIPHWKALGVDTVLFGPIFDSESHGYDTRDLRCVDPRLGTNDDMRSLADKLHASGIKVILDAVLNHTGRSFAVFQELVASQGRGEKSTWYKGVDPAVQGPDGVPFQYQGWNGHARLPELNLKNVIVVEYLLETAAFWMDAFDIDGLRLDAADVLDFDFMRVFSDFCRSRKPGFWLLGEVIHGEYERWVASAGLDSVTNYHLYKALWSSLNERNFFELTWTLDRQFGPSGIAKDWFPTTFLDNHDVSRLASVVKDSRHLSLLYELMFFLPGVPSLYYGSEWDWTGEKGQGPDWNLRPGCRPWEMAHEVSRVEQLGALALLRRTEEALRSGSFSLAGNTHTFLAFTREFEGNRLLVAVNVALEPAHFGVDIPETGWRQVWGPAVDLRLEDGRWKGDIPALCACAFLPDNRAG